MMLKFLRLLKILRVSVQYGLDEIAISGLKKPRIAKLIDTVFFWRDLSAPRGVRLRDDVERAAKRLAKLEQKLAPRSAGLETQHQMDS